MTKTIKGNVENGRRGNVELPFYTGEVGVRERGDQIELAWFGKRASIERPVDGTLDGAAIRVISVSSREPMDGQRPRQGAAAFKVNVAIAQVIDAPADDERAAP